MSRWLRPYGGGRGRRQSSELPVEYYPNSYAGSTRATDPGDGNDPETGPVRCAQCGFNIEDRNKEKQCPHCESDNFEGGALRY